MTDRIPTISPRGRVVDEIPASSGPAEVVELKPKPKPDFKPTPTQAKVDDIEALLKLAGEELARARTLYPREDYPLVGSQNPDAARAYYEKQATGWKKIYAQRQREGVTGWDDILLEEVYEAISEPDPEAAIVELVQVAAMAVRAALSLQAAQR